MKNIILAIALVMGTGLAWAEKGEVKTKEVCTDVVGKDGKPVKNKDGTVKQTCKTIKVHQKREGTEVPPQPKK
jgi:hypothetical protein